MCSGGKLIFDIVKHIDGSLLYFFSIELKAQHIYINTKSIKLCIYNHRVDDWNNQPWWWSSAIKYRRTEYHVTFSFSGIAKQSGMFKKNNNKNVLFNSSWRKCTTIRFIGIETGTRIYRRHFLMLWLYVRNRFAQLLEILYKYRWREQKNP